MPANPTTERRSGPILFYVLLAAGLVVFIKTFALLSPILLSLLLIVLITLAVNPVISRLRAWTGGRKGAAGLVTVALVALIGLTGWAFYEPMQASVADLSEKVPEYWERLQKPLIKMEQQAERSEEKLQAEVTTEIANERAAAGQPEVTSPKTKTESTEPDQESKPIRTGLGEMLQTAFGGLTEMVFNAAQMLVVLITVFFGVTFMLMNPRPIFGAGFSLIPERYHGQTLIIMRRIGKFVPGWAGATLAGMLTIGLLVFLLMWPIFGFKDALVLGLIAGVLEAIPFLGPILSAIPALLLALGKGGMTPLWVLLAYIAAQHRSDGADGFHPAGRAIDLCQNRLSQMEAVA